ncbi:MAG: S-methyl-5-thioribose kinase [Turicibacter sp.]|nr:S-methyl-5-thioribose kinase [Turicibacter sp.]
MLATEKEVIDYIRNFSFFEEGADLSCKEIGDGNLNYVYRLEDVKTGKSIILKQSGLVARISDEFKVSPDRNRIESEILKLQAELAPGFVPEVYHFDKALNCTIMEDLSDHEILRTALLNKKTFPQFSSHITTFLVNTLLMTSDVVLGHPEKKERAKSFTNPGLCEITEDLVFTEPFYPCPRNEITPGMEGFVQEVIWDDGTLLLETAKLKFGFMSHSQSLVHGDLHTGSIFVRPDSTKVFDPEFSFYGPAGYDLGNILANLIFAYANNHATGYDAKFSHYLEATLQEITDGFQSKFLETWESVATEPTAKYAGFKEYYLGQIMADAFGVAGHELARRIIGIAKVKDITSIEGLSQRILAEKFCLALGKTLIMERAAILDGTQFLKTIKSHASLFAGDFQTRELTA